jgi:hypothetical protein
MTQGSRVVRLRWVVSTPAAPRGPTPSLVEMLDAEQIVTMWTT